MKKAAYFIVFMTFAAINQSIFAAKLTIINNTQSFIEAIIRYGNNYSVKTVMIPIDQSVSVNSGIQHGFKSIAWRIQNTGVYHALSIPSTHTMLDGKIKLEKNGGYLINFNAQGVYKKSRAEGGMSPQRDMQPNNVR